MATTLQGQHQRLFHETNNGGSFMTPKRHHCSSHRKSVKSAHRKSSAELLDEVRRSCLERAKSNRREAVLSRREALLARNQESRSESPFPVSPLRPDGARQVTPASEPAQSQQPSPNRADALQLVESELLARGISCPTPLRTFETAQTRKHLTFSDDEETEPQPTTHKRLRQRPPTHPANCDDDDDDLWNDDVEDHSPKHTAGSDAGGNCDEGIEISEEEVYDLLKDVEDEMRRQEEEFLLEEHLQEVEREQEEQECLVEADIVAYEEYLEEQRLQDTRPSATCPKQNDAEEESQVLCPVCNTANLRKSPMGIIFCPNTTLVGSTGSGRCTLRLDVSCDGLTLEHLSHHIEAAREEHADSAPEVCTALTFRVSDSFTGIPTLLAECVPCGMRTVIL